METRKLPIGIQDFEDMRRNDYLYVDKTAMIYKMVSGGKPYFLSRPRRFGKSLLLSTLKAYFEGKKELFAGLAIAELETEWQSYPVLHIDLSGATYDSVRVLELSLLNNLSPFEKRYGLAPEQEIPALRFENVLRAVCEKTGKKVAVLIDEYDQPLLETLNKPEIHDAYIEKLRGFYGVLKRSDPYLKFVLITGITKFSKVMIFSQLNQLRDISMERDYAGICGMTESELLDTFSPELQSLAESNDCSLPEVIEKMHHWYNGYHFAKTNPSKTNGVFNPFSVLNTLAKGDFSYYWFQSGTPSFLVKMIHKQQFDVKKLEEGITVPAQIIEDYRINNPNLIPVLYQSGYLTIKGVEPFGVVHPLRLGYPNNEVKYGFLMELIQVYAPQTLLNSDFSLSLFHADLQNGDIDAFMTRLRALFASIPYGTGTETRGEYFYQSIMYVLFSLLGELTASEVRSSAGRADLVVTTGGAIYVFEFKLEGSGTAEEALAQIDGKGYLIPYTAGTRELVKIGAEFDESTHTLGRWLRG
jgi:hypothetical protein